MKQKIFIFFLFLPLIFLPFDYKEISILEKRSLQTFELKYFLRDFKNFSKFFNDHFPFREELISNYFYLNHLLGFSVHPNLFIGKEGYLFLKHQNNITDKQRNIIYPSLEQLNSIKNNLINIYEFADKNNLSLFFVPVPDQQTIHYLKLPKWHSKLKEFDKYEEFNKIFIEIDRPRNFIDMRKDLISNNKPISPTYHRYEGHWTNFGSYIAAKAIMKKLMIYDNNSYIFNDSSFIWPDLLLSEKVRNVQIDITGHQKKLILSDNYEKYYKYFFIDNIDNKNNDNLLIYGDSFTLENTQFLHYFIRNFSSVSRVSANHQKLSNSLINIIEPNTIFVCIVERNFFTPELFESIANAIKD